MNRLEKLLNILTLSSCLIATSHSYTLKEDVLDSGYLGEVTFSDSEEVVPLGIDVKVYDESFNDITHGNFSTFHAFGGTWYEVLSSTDDITTSTDEGALEGEMLTIYIGGIKSSPSLFHFPGFSHRVDITIPYTIWDLTPTPTQSPTETPTITTSPTPISSVVGDLNNDGKRDYNDIFLFSKEWYK